MRSDRRVLAGITLLLLTAGLAPTALAGPAAEHQRLRKLAAPALVTLRFVLEVKMFGAPSASENELEISGVLIDPHGLVLCSNSKLSGYTSAFQSLLGPDKSKVRATPTELTVLVGDDAEGRPATLVARDSELDLAWVQIEDTDAKALPYLDLTKSATPREGDRLLTLYRKEKLFDRLIVVGEGYVAGIAEKPRRLFVPGGEIGDALGLPAFTTKGRVVGVLVLQMPEAEIDGAAPNPMDMFNRLFGNQKTMAGSVLPAAEVVAATTRALKSDAGK